MEQTTFTRYKRCLQKALKLIGSTNSASIHNIYNRLLSLIKTHVEEVAKYISRLTDLSKLIYWDAVMERTIGVISYEIAHFSNSRLGLLMNAIINCLEDTVLYLESETTL